MPAPGFRTWGRGLPQINHPETGSPYSAAMDRAEQLRDELAFVDRMIAESQLHISRLKKIIADMSRDAQDTDLARDVMANYTAALARHEAQRRLIVSMVDKEMRDEAKPAATKPRSPTRPRPHGGRRGRSQRSAGRR